MTDVIEKVILAEAPMAIPSQAIYVYAPVASTATAGLARFSANDFLVDNGLVRLNNVWKLSNMDVYDGNLNHVYTGSYLIGYNATNTPEPSIKMYGALYSFQISTTSFVQYAFMGNGKVYTRQFAAPNWTEWKEFAYTKSVDNLQAQISALSDRVNTITGNKETQLLILLQPGENLPETGLSNKIYLKPIVDGENPNLFDEYIWVNDSWEYLGQSGLSIDTSNFVTKQDFIVGSSAPTTSTIAPFVGALYLDSANNKTYQCTAITSEGGTTTYTWVKLIRETDFVYREDKNNKQAGIIAPCGKDDSFGIITPTRSYKGQVIIRRALNADIDKRVPSNYIDNGIPDDKASRLLPICGANIDYAHYQVITNPKDGANDSYGKWSWSINDRLKGLKFYNIEKFLLGCNIPLTITSVSNDTYTATIYTNVSVGDYLITADMVYLQIASVTANSLQDPSEDYIKPSPDAVTKTTTYTITFTAVSGTFTAVANDFFYVAHSKSSNISSAYVKKTDYAREATHGLVKVNSSFGIWLPNGPSAEIAINRATDDMVVGRSGPYRPLTGGHVDLIVSEGLGNCKDTSLWTKEAKANARTLLGINTETWTFTLEDGSIVTKKVLVLADTEA